MLLWDCVFFRLHIHAMTAGCYDIRLQNVKLEDCASYFLNDLLNTVSDRGVRDLCICLFY